MKITKITAREILDSRGNPTIEATVHTTTSKGTASIPSGASRGKHEAKELRDNTKRYAGWGVQKAIKTIITIIQPALVKKLCTQQREIDTILRELDGTKNFSKLGANSALAISLACARAAANAKKVELFKYLHSLPHINKKKSKLCIPTPFSNLINGGKHADNSLSFQEFMVVPMKKTIKENLQIVSEVYHALKTILHKKYGKGATNIGDEGGFAPPQIQTTTQALSLLGKAITAAGYKKHCAIAIDAAASEFYTGKHYYKVDGRKITTEELTKFYLKLIKKFPIISIEDPFHQEDFAAFAQLRSQTSIQIVSDDLTTTNPKRIQKAVKASSCNCLLLKPNQIGTLSDALDAANLALFNHWGVMVSHRSGETNDTFIADLAVALGCGMIKSGAPARSERTSKYNRLLEIEQILS